MTEPVDIRVPIARSEVVFEAGQSLTAAGLGSCIGLALVDQTAGVVAMAHVYLPKRPDDATGDPPGKYADTAIPHLVELATKRGANRARLRAALVGGAQMFGQSSNASAIGVRNVAAVAEQLQLHRIRVIADVTGGTTGRTMRAHGGSGLIEYWKTGDPPTTLVERSGIALRGAA